MNIELKEIDKDTLKVGDLVGIARKVSYGWKSSFRHQLITTAQIIRITPKRTKFFTDKFGEHDKGEIFYEPDSNAVKENHLAMQFMYLRKFQRKAKADIMLTRAKQEEFLVTSTLFFRWSNGQMINRGLLRT